MHPLIGFKTAEPAYTDGIVDRFYRPLIAAGIAPVVMSIDSAGHCYDVWKLVAGTALQNAAVMHFFGLPPSAAMPRCARSIASSRNRSSHPLRQPKSMPQSWRRGRKRRSATIRWRQSRVKPTALMLMPAIT